jgi:hypothetical protein
MTQHTPGPWATSKGAYGALHVGPATLAHPGREVAQYAAERGRDLLAQRAADVALIAAAPDMLVALERLSSVIAAPGLEDGVPADCPIDVSLPYGAILALWRAITKAKGGAA